MPDNIDCIALKDKVQEAIRRENEGLTDDEIRKRILKKLDQSDSIIARKWRELKAAKAGH